MTVFKYIGPMYMIYNLEFLINRWQNNEIEFTHAAKKRHKAVFIR